MQRPQRTSTLLRALCGTALRPLWLTALNASGFLKLEARLGASLLNQPLTYSVNEVSVCGTLPAGPHEAGNLSAMVGRMHDDVSQHVHNRACPLLAFAVLVRNRLRNVAGSDQIEELKPHPTQFSRLLLTLCQVWLRPHRHALRLLFQPLQPDQFRGQNMGHQLQRSLVRAARRSDRIQNSPVRPFIVGKLAAQIISKIHKTALRLSWGHPM